MKNHRVRNALVVAVVVLLLTMGLAAWLVSRSPAGGGYRGLLRWWRLLREQETLEMVLRDLGPWGPLFIVLAEIIQVLLAPLPGQVVGLVSGYLYGFWAGTAFCMIGLAIGTLLTVWVARRLGRPLVERLVSPRILGRIDGYAERRGALALLLIFLLPFLPDDLCCFVAGLTPLRIVEIVILGIIGRAPGLVISTLLGSRAQELTWPQLAAVGIIGLVLAILFGRYQHSLEHKMFRLVDRLVPREQDAEN